MTKKQDGEAKDIGALLEIMARLRDPETGCPWDIKQSFKSIAPYTIEEAYEVVDAIERDDMAALKDELGDLLLQVVFHARMAEEEDQFAFSDVVDAVCDKMVRRHPHVFGETAIGDADAQTASWEALKAEERARKSGVKGEGRVLADLPIALPALMRAVKLQKRAARVGFDWPNWSFVIDKAYEEVGELKEAAESGDKDHIQEELGDILFVLANFGRHFKIDPEVALKGTNAKFTRRFEYIEDRLNERGKTPEQSNLEEMDALWNEAKSEEF